jgi:regulatory protein
VEAYRYLIQLLVHKDYARKTIEEKLSRKGFSSSEIEEALELASSRNEFSEQRYLEARLRGLLRKNFGPVMIQQKLKNEGISLSLLEVKSFALESGHNFEQSLQQVMAKKTSTPPAELEFPEKRKLMSYLLSRGFEGEEVQDALQKLEATTRT